MFKKINIKIEVSRECQFLLYFEVSVCLDKRNGNNYFRRVVSRTIAKSNMKLFVTKVNSWNPLTFFTKTSILDFAVVLDTPLFRMGYSLVT